MAFHGSSFFLESVSLRYLATSLMSPAGYPHLIPFTAQSSVGNSPPQTPRLPPRTGERAFMAVIAPMHRSPWAALDISM
jgi:hypothetical protein